MSSTSNVLLDCEQEFIYFTGKISKHVTSKGDSKDQKIIGVNINDLKVFDKFHKGESKIFLNEIQEETKKYTKKDTPRPFLTIFAPKIVNKALEKIDKYPIGTYVKMKVSSGFNKQKKKQYFNAIDLEYCKENIANTKERNGTGIMINSKFIGLDKLTFKSAQLLELLDKIYDNQEYDTETALSLNSLINKWLSKGIEIQKKREYEEERAQLEKLKKAEAIESSKALLQALNSVKTIYKQSTAQAKAST
jgi:hypothetical protein